METDLVDEKMSAKILRQVKQQESQEFDNFPIAESSQEQSAQQFSYTEQEEYLDIPEADAVDLDIDEEDAEAMDLFMTADRSKRGVTLGQMIREKLGLINEAMPDMEENREEQIEKSNLPPELCE